ncbi:MAG: cytochrome c biogenesis protein CcdA [Acidimicrobiales bacterium]|nr:cytochrome c biogenesis protein CcdA [Acidimicrobiales bacterium]
MIDIGIALPFTLGIVTAVNPCGFAMLPTWLGYFIGRDRDDTKARPEQVMRGLVVSFTLTGAFVMVFGLLGLAVTYLVSEDIVARRTPWVTVAIGAVLIPYGMAILTNRKPNLSFLQPRRGPRSRELFSVFWFGVSYAVVSIGCAAPLFLLHIAGSFQRDGIIEGLVVYLVFAAGMSAVPTALTLSLTIARGGAVRHLRRLLPHVDRIGAFAMLLGGSYLVVYGIYEIRILADANVGSNPIVNTVTKLQSHLANWTSDVGGTRVGLALWLLVLTVTTWGIGPGIATNKRRRLQVGTATAWVVFEGVMYRGELALLPIIHVAMTWPSRISHWLSDPIRWAVPLEVLVTATTALILLTWVRATLQGSTGRHRP